MTTMKFTTEHEWLRLEQNDEATIGITDYAQDQLGDIVYVELPEVGKTFAAGEQTVGIESVKAGGEINAPRSMAVTAVNERLVDEPELVNSNPLGDGWLIRVKLEPGDDLSGLLDEAAYKSYIDAL